MAYWPVDRPDHIQGVARHTEIPSNVIQLFVDIFFSSCNHLAEWAYWYLACDGSRSAARRSGSDCRQHSFERRRQLSVVRRRAHPAEHAEWSSTG